MLENNPIQLQVSQAATILGANIKICLHALEELRRMSLILFTSIRADDSDIQDWFASENFGVDEDGFWTSLSLLQAFRENKAPPHAISYSWHPDLVQDPDACFRMYCLKDIGPYLEEIRSRLPMAAWIYYQDLTNTAVQFPYIDQKTAITPDFDWSTYHTWVSVSPENNPDRKIQWTSPSIDYAGEGLIISVSIPVYLSDRFTGLWSIDLPLKSLYQKEVLDAFMKHQVNFIIDQNGLLVTHPWIEAEIDREKGSIYRCHVYDLGQRFKALDPATLLDMKTGQMILAHGMEEETVVWFEAIPDIQWVFIATLPRQSMEDAVNRRIRKALDRVRSGDFTHRIREMTDLDQAGLVAEGFNQMVDALENQEKHKQQALEEKAKLEQRLHHSQRMEAIGTLAGGIAHDFNNILFPILGYSELLLNDLPKSGPEHEMVKQIYTSAGRARDLTKQILTFSRQSEIQNQIISVPSIVKEALKLLRASIPKNIEILTTINKDCPLVLGDPTKLHQIIMNLCTNAFHAVEDTGGKLEVSLEPVTISEEKAAGIPPLLPGSYLRLTVSDNGCGMAPETLMQIFNPYFTTKTEGKGTGLGLSVIYGIVKKLKGDIRVYSEPGQGSSFHVFLPEAPPSDIEKRPKPSIIERGNEHILLVDDETSIAHLGKQALERFGYRVTMFTNSIAALEAFSKKPSEFDMLITDMAMPEMTGDILAARIKAIRKDIPVILCTGFSERISSDAHQTDAVDSFFMKPFSLSDINPTIRSLLKRRSPN